MNKELAIKKPLQFAYLILALLFVVFILAEFLFMRNDYYNAREATPAKLVTEYTHEWVENENLPAGGLDSVSWTLDSDYTELDCLTFYTIHQYVHVYVGDELVYSLTPNENNFVGKTVGNQWNYLHFQEADAGKNIRIELTPAYKSNIGSLPEFYIGDNWDVFHFYLKRNLWIFLMSVTSVVFGGIFHIWMFANRKRQEMDSATLHLGTFALLIGCWEISDLNTADFFVSNKLAFSTLPIISLFLATIPVLMFIRDFFKNRREIFYNVILALAITACYATLWLQVFDIKDLRESLPVSHVILVILIVSTIRDMMVAIKHDGWTRRIKVAVFSLITSFFGLVVDLFVYYRFDGKVSTGLGMLGFLAYIAAMGIYMVKESIALIEKGKQAGLFKEMAYKDVLTGCFSRAAYMEEITSKNFEAENMTAVMLDVNNLKKCNDTRGHEAGDALIKKSAEFIKKAFGEMGKCYRIGGDEFCVLMDSAKEDKCNKAIDRLEKAEFVYNSENPNAFPIVIAAGYASFNNEKDFDITDTVRRADKYMYINKMELKGDTKNGANNN